MFESRKAMAVTERKDFFMNLYKCVFPIAAITLSPAAAAHEPSQHSEKSKEVTKEQQAWGIAAESKKPTRTIAVDMADTMRFSPSDIQVKKGETVKFVVSNSGKTLHEMVLGTEEALQKHSELMRKFPGMEHDEPYMAHVPPGGKEEINWTFNRAGTFHYGCLIPGHWEAGMKGRITVAAK